MSARRFRWAAVLAVLAVSACAGIPSSGPVTKVEDDAGLGGSTVRYSPTGPLEDGTPEQIVRGFLDAMLAYPASTRTASAFLTPQAASKWNPAAGISVYSVPNVAGRVPSSKALGDAQSGSKATVDVRLGLILEAELDSQGHYTPRGTSESVTYTLQRSEGQWRIVNPPPGLMVNAKFFSDYLRPFNLYFFDHPGRRLVPDPVHLVVGDQLATSLVTSLVRGPAARLGTSTRTYVPPLPELRPSVPVSRDGVAEVEFTADLAGMGGTASDRMSAQLVWTLRQVPSIDSVQILADTASLLDARRAIQPVSSWGGFGPRVLPGKAHAVIGNRVVTIDEGDIIPLDGAWGKNARNAESVAVSESGVAAVLPGRREARITKPDGSGSNQVFGSEFITPHWDLDGQLWLVDAMASRTRVRVGRVGNLRAVKTTTLDDLDVESFSVSPDGTRYVVGVRNGSSREVRVGMVLRDADDRIRGLSAARKVLTTAKDPRAVSWGSSTELDFLADGRVGAQVTHVAIDGSDSTGELDRGSAVLPDVGIESLVVGVGDMSDQYAADAKGRLWFRSGEAPWRLIETPEVTALSHGS
ncbi:LpqB family beta-propeller domain-containing protein [Aeromicrobium sp. P5_D10]